MGLDTYKNEVAGTCNLSGISCDGQTRITFCQTDHLVKRPIVRHDLLRIQCARFDKSFDQDRSHAARSDKSDFHQEPLPEGMLYILFQVYETRTLCMIGWPTDFHI